MQKDIITNKSFIKWRELVSSLVTNKTKLSPYDYFYIACTGLNSINQDDDILSINIPYEGTNREVIIVTSTEDKYRNHTESLKDVKLFLEPGDCTPKVLYKQYYDNYNYSQSITRVY